VDKTNIYGSGLNAADWLALRDAIWPFLHAKEPGSVELSHNLPEHLRDHAIISLLGTYRETSDDRYLDYAGQLLIPASKPFGWYLVLTK
jgi:hypothetical protein